MAITYGSDTRGADFGGGINTLSFNSPNVSGSLVVAKLNLAIRTAGGGGNSVSSATWNGVAMTRVGSEVQDAGSIFLCSQWILVAPAAGVTTVTFTTTNNWSAAFGTAKFFNGVNQTTPTDGSNTNIVTASGSFSDSITTTVNNDFLDDVVIEDGGCPTLVNNTGTQDRNGCDGIFGFATSHDGPFAIGSNSLGWTVTPNGNWIGCICALQPDVPASGLPVNTKSNTALFDIPDEIPFLRPQQRHSIGVPPGPPRRSFVFSTAVDDSISLLSSTFFGTRITRGPPTGAALGSPTKSFISSPAVIDSINLLSSTFFGTAITKGPPKGIPAAPVSTDAFSYLGNPWVVLDDD